MSLHFRCNCSLSNPSSDFTSAILVMASSQRLELTCRCGFAIMQMKPTTIPHDLARIAIDICAVQSGILWTKGCRETLRLPVRNRYKRLSDKCDTIHDCLQRQLAGQTVTISQHNIKWLRCILMWYNNQLLERVYDNDFRLELRREAREQLDLSNKVMDFLNKHEL